MNGLTLPAELPAARGVQTAIEALIGAIDNAKAAGCTIPPVAAVAVANLGVSLVVIAGSEAHQLGAPSPFAGLHGPTLGAAVLTIPTTPGDTQ